MIKEYIYDNETNKVIEITHKVTEDISSRHSATSGSDKLIKLKMNLARTDYQAIKFAEGQMSAEEYEPIRIQRQAWRDEINSISNS